uniref:protein root UVB sensitive 4 isoform X2 n=1 Tax=Erigeron canadensis TaxID=72917 RepID=UPI001CB9B609|nr:protein root UVB sensitive 4 isoform X2 [Erigeron canadensis]
MQSPFHIPTSNPTFNFSSKWQKHNKVQIFFPNPCFPRFSKPPPKSLKTSFQFEYEEEKMEKQVEPTLLPVVIKQSDGCVSRYFWDGNDLKLVFVDGFDKFDDFGDVFRRCKMGVRNFLLPRKINENYLEYVKWKFLHRVFSSALQVLATQAMFRAIGIGYARSLPSAAALNWVLKDGLGRLSRCIYTASLASAFDTNLKRVRFLTSVVFSLSIGLELMTPAFPQYFLLLASIANIAKQISLACYLATGTAVHRSFAVADNLGEVSAKAQIQTVCFDNLGLMLAAALNIILKNNQRWQAGLPFVVYPIFTAIDLYGIYQSLKHVHLQTITKDRLEIIIDTWIQRGYVPSPAEVSKREGINFFSTKDRLKWPIRIGCLNSRFQIPKISMMTMRSLCKDDFYFVCTEICFCGFQKREGILLSIREGATTSDIIMGFLQACYIRERLLCNMKKPGILEVYDNNSHQNITNWFNLAAECKESAREGMKLLNEKMVEIGWSCKNILLSTNEQTRFSFIDD